MYRYIVYIILYFVLCIHDTRVIFETKITVQAKSNLKKIDFFKIFDDFRQIS